MSTGWPGPTGTENSASDYGPAGGQGATSEIQTEPGRERGDAAPRRGSGRDQGHVSLVIPVFNEEARLGPSLERIVSFLESQPHSSEVVIVDDGSQDGTSGLVRERFPSQGIKLYQNSRNQGKGEAVRQGMHLARGEHLFFSDADLSVPIEMLPEFLSALETRYDVTIGCRRKAGAVIEAHQPLYRELLGRVYSRLAKEMLGLTVCDVTCGFKGFRRDVARDLFSQQRLKDWSFDTEILYLATLRGYRILEIPVRWRNDRGTKVRLGRDVLLSFVGLLRIRANGCLGRYKS